MRDEAARMGESQLSELRNMRVLLEEARGLARDLAYHRRAKKREADEGEGGLVGIARWRSAGSLGIPSMAP